MTIRRTVTLTVVAAVLLVGVAGESSPESPRDEPATTRTPTAQRRAPVPEGIVATTPSVLLVWGHGGIADSLADVLDDLPGVTATSVVAGDRVDVVATRDAAGGNVLELPSGWFVPLDAQALDPTAHAPFVSDRTARTLAGLRPGTVVLADEAADLRGLGPGAELVTARGDVLTVHGTVPADEIGWAELVQRRDDPTAVTHPRYALVATTDPDGTAAALRSGVEEGLRVVAADDARHVRHGDAVLPPLALKQAFGEFTIRDVPGRWLRLGASWRGPSLTVADVPLLGTVECHEAMIPPLRAAMQELIRRGRGDAIDPARYGGCWAGRVIGASRTLSHHSWGIAIDLNVDPDDPYDATTMDPVVVEVMKDHGFVWGGDFLRPDPPHFELAVPPDETG